MPRGLASVPATALACCGGLALLTGCATAGPARRDPPLEPGGWHVATTRHLELWTDAGPEAARALAGRLEPLQPVLARALGGPGAAPLRARLVLPSAPGLVAALAGPRVAGFSTVLTEVPTAVAAARRALADPSVLVHELVHLLVARRLVRPPHWLDEGLAEALETAGRPGAPPGMVGAPPPWAAPGAGWRPAPGFVRRLLAWDGRPDPEAPRRDASAAWLLVHFLRNEEGAGLEALLRRLEGGQEAEAAWRAVFPAWSEERLLGPDLLEERVLAFHATGRHALVSFPRAEAPEVAVRAASPADVRLLWLELPRRERRTPEALRAEVLEALRLAPDHPQALRLLAQLDGRPALPLARRAVAAHPEDWRAWSFLAGALRSEGAPPAEREAALRRAAALAPGQAGPLRALADQLAAERRTDEAAPLAWLALELRPWDPAVLETYAAAASDLGACPVAPDAARRAGALLASPALDPARQRRVQALDRLERRCDLARFAETAFAAREARAGR